MSNIKLNTAFLKGIIEISLNKYIKPLKVEVLSVDCHDRLDLPGMPYEIRIILKQKRNENET